MNYPQFRNDYSMLCDKKIIEKLNQYYNEINIAYGLDYHTDNARKLIKARFNLNHDHIYFVNGGTLANICSIAHFLKSHEGIIAVKTAHINVHEAASIEATGHKIYTVEGINGKLTANDIENAVSYHSDFHMMRPKLVYISNSTETGTIYKYDELKSLSEVCKKYNLYLFIDGARLAQALTSSINDVKIEQLKDLCDAFYLGGTKNGLMNGEAIIINNEELNEGFLHQLKLRGAILAKGALYGIQFEAIMEDDYFLKLARQANLMADYIYESLKNDYEMIPTHTNQLFVTLNKNQALDLIDKFQMELWSIDNNRYTIRIVTSFYHTREDCDILIAEMKNN